MQVKNLLKLLLSLPLAASALEMQPWFGNVYEFHFLGDYTYSRYNKVDHATPPLKHPSNDQLFLLGLDFCPSSSWDLDLDVEFVHTPRQEWGFRSAAAQIRRLWLDDVLYDSVSLTTGLLLRGVSGTSLKDVSCPYHAAFDMEMNIAIGKEWSSSAFWRYRLFGFGALGIGNRGSPWSRAHVAIELNSEDVHRYELFSDGYFGYGNEETINIKHFHSYAHIHHKSVDVGLSYGYMMSVWGTLYLSYAHRVYARSFPANTNFFSLSYNLPFSLF